MFSWEGLETEKFISDGVDRLMAEGYVIFEGLLDQTFVSKIHEPYQKRIDAPVAYAGKVGRAMDRVNVSYIDYPLTLHKNAVKFAVCDSLIQMIETYLESSVVLSYTVAYRTHIIADLGLRTGLKTPGAFSGWHSDANLIAPGRGYRLVVSMVYLNEVRPGGGGMQVIRGSHTYGSKKRAWTDEEIEARSEDIVELCAPAGSVILFDMEIIHRAGIPSTHSRDMIRFMYAPEGGYTEPQVLLNSTIPSGLSQRAARVLGLGKTNSISLPLSEGAPPTKFSPQWTWMRLSRLPQKVKNRFLNSIG